MPLYETTFIVRQDVLSHEVEKLAEQFSGLIKSNQGKIVKTEHWGLRDLAYPIKKCSKGYYVHLGIDAPFAAIKEMERRIGLNEDVIRCITFKVEAISKNPSPLIAPEEEGEEIVIGGRDAIKEEGEVANEN